MKTTTIKEIEETTGGSVSPEFYYEWGNESAGYVTTGLYMDDAWYSTGQVKKDEAIAAGLQYHCPYS